jgi:SOS-response transcriptional repressor LexA
MKYKVLKASLATTGMGRMKVFGHSMEPIIASGALLEFRVKATYEVGDVVFCKVRGRYIDAHKIIKKAPDGRYLIANNKGWENGWTSQVYAAVVL